MTIYWLISIGFVVRYRKANPRHRDITLVHQPCLAANADVRFLDFSRLSAHADIQGLDVPGFAADTHE